MKRHDFSCQVCTVSKILLHLSRTRRRVVDTADIFWIEVAGDDTVVRLRSSKRLRDVRKLES